LYLQQGGFKVHGSHWTKRFARGHCPVYIGRTNKSRNGGVFGLKTSSTIRSHFARIGAVNGKRLESGKIFRISIGYYTLASTASPWSLSITIMLREDHRGGVPYLRKKKKFLDFSSGGGGGFWWVKKY